jgi:Activator of Hsp90 ATPase homolog 1-like protein
MARQRLAQLHDVLLPKRKMIVPLTSVTKDAVQLTLPSWATSRSATTSVGRLCRPAPTRALWGPPFAPATFTRHDMKVGGRSEYFLTLPDGGKWSGSWKFTAVNPISSFEARDGEDNAEDQNLPASMRFTFETTPTGSRLTSVTWFESVEAMEQTVPGMEEGLRAAMPQLDAVLAERSASAVHA